MAHLYKHSFDPIVSPQTEILVLGSVPGDRSLAENQYYAHPHNRFWKVLSAITHSDVPQKYVEKKQWLLRNHFGVWDVAHRAVRAGSMDSNIKLAEPNDLPRLISALPQLHTIAFNGKKAESLFDQFFVRHTAYRYFSLPSTSPANAAYSLQRLCETWRAIRTTEV